ncbi:hypothetical protein ABZP36_002483 [Zizania latifolia]
MKLVHLGCLQDNHSRGNMGAIKVNGIFAENAFDAVMHFAAVAYVGRLGEAPRPELREHGRISGACFDAALGIIPGLKVKGTDYETPDGTCVIDYIDVTDLVDAHVKTLNKVEMGKVGIYNVGTGKGHPEITLFIQL